MKLERVDKSISRVVNDNGQIVGFAMLMSNGRWAAFSPEETRLTKAGVSFAKPTDVLKFFQEAALEGGE